MDFRRSTPSDVTEIAVAEAAIFPDPWSERDISDTIMHEGAMCFSAIKDGRLVAYVLGRIIPPEGEIYRVAVLPEYRERGIGYRLLDYAAKCARGDGLEVLFLEVRSKNLPALALYRAYGFKKIGERRGYYKNPPDDAIVMLKASKQDLIN